MKQLVMSKLNVAEVYMVELEVTATSMKNNANGEQESFQKLIKLTFSADEPVIARYLKANDG